MKILHTHKNKFYKDLYLLVDYNFIISSILRIHVTICSLVQGKNLNQKNSVIKKNIKLSPNQTFNSVKFSLDSIDGIRDYFLT